MQNRDVVIIKKIVKYSNEIYETIIFYELNYNKFIKIML